MTRKRIIHFSHANGFPAETYHKFFHYLKDEFRIGFINVQGHDPDYPVTDNWHALVKELTDYIAQTYHEPVIGVGHSLGGVLTCIAAIKKPELFSSIVLLDSPVFGVFRSKLLQLAKQFGFIDKVTQAHRAKVRRNEWSNYAEAETYFKSKGLFRNFDPDCLRDYVHYGTDKTAHGIKLKFDRAIEYKIFRTMPHHLSRYRGKLTVPGALIYGEKSTVIKASDLLNMQKHFHFTCARIAGGHLFPFEYPQLAAETLKKVITGLHDSVHDKN